MKRLLMLLLLFFAATVGSAQVPLEMNQEGKFRKEIKSLEKWNKSDIVAEALALKYVKKFPEAISHPGEQILVEKKERTIKLKPVFKKLVEVEKDFIVYNDLSKRINYVELKTLKQESSYLMLSGIASLILMVISNVLFSKNNNLASFVFAVASFVFALIFAIVVANAFVILVAATIFAIIVAFVAALVVIDDENYKMVSIIYYILMSVCFVLLFV